MVKAKLQILNQKDVLNKLIIDIKENTNLKSPKSIYEILKFYNKIFTYFNIDINNYKNNYKSIIISKEDVNNLCYKDDKEIHNAIHWFKKFFKYIIETNQSSDESFDTLFTKKPNYEYTLKKEIKDLHFITPDELDFMYNNSNDKEKLIIKILITTGIRASAFCNITLEDINFETGEINTIEKNNKQVTYYFNNSILEEICRINLFNSNKRLMTAEHLCVCIKRICKKCNFNKDQMKRIHPHSFRHTYAKILINNNVEINDIQKLLGHSNKEVTEQFYLKERIFDVHQRVNIPWNKIKKVKTIPDFLLI
jgi:integrase/recombinase XerD